MEQTDADPSFDIEAYRSNTDDLLESMKETTGLMNEMADNMATLSESFAAFDPTRDDLRDATAAMERSGPAVGAD